MILILFFSYQSKVVENIGGVEGKANGEQVTEKVVHSMISSNLLVRMSWTGKGAKNETKIKFCNRINLINFIKTTVRKADRAYNDEKFEKKLIYGILKRAPSKFGNKCQTKSRSRASSTSSQNSYATQPEVATVAELQMPLVVAETQSQSPPQQHPHIPTPMQHQIIPMQQSQQPLWKLALVVIRTLLHGSHS